DCPRQRGSARPSLLGRPQWQGEPERAALAELAVAPDFSAVHLDEALRQRQPEPGPLPLASAEVGLLKLLENPVEILRGDTRAGVGNGDRDLAVGPRRTDIDLPARRREFH